MRPILIISLLGLSTVLFSQTGEKRLPSHPYHEFRSGLENSLIKFEREKTGRVAFLGGSITYNGGWRDSICQYLRQRFPDTEFEFIAAGIPSMGSTPGAFRLQRDVLSQGPVDLLFEEAAVNDATNGRSDLEQVRAMEGIVRYVRRDNPAADIVFMYFVDPDKMEAYRRGEVPRVIRNHEKVAAHYGIPSIDLAREVTDRIDAGEFTWADDFKDLHPSPFGQRVYSLSMLAFLEKAWDDPDMPSSAIKDKSHPPLLDPASYDRGQLLHIRSARVDDHWTVDENWTPGDGKGTRANYVNVPMLVAETPGAALSLAFQGNAVGIAVAAGPDAGVVEYRLDDGPWQRQDLFTRWSAGLHLPWYYTLAAGLERGKHTLTLRVVTRDAETASRGNACRIRYFFVNE